MRKDFRRSPLGPELLIALTALLLLASAIACAAQERKTSQTAVRQNKDAPQQPAALLQAPAGAVDKFVTVYGAKIHYVEAGSGPVVILLHGLGSNTSSWNPTIGPLAAKYRVIVPDQIGFGSSAKPFINYRVGTLVDFLDGFYKALKIERASLVGNSLGGWAAAAYTIAHPERVERLVLVDAAGYQLPEGTTTYQLSALNPSTREGIRQIMSTIFYNKQMFASDAVVDVLFAAKMTTGDGYTIQRFIESIARDEDILDNKLMALKLPTLIVWGREDSLTTLKLFGERFKREIAGSRLLIFDKCGHVPQIEKAADFNSALLSFLGGADVGSK